MTMTKTPVVPQARAGRQAWAESVLRQAERKVGINREAHTLQGGFYRGRSEGVFGALGVTVGNGMTVGSSGSTALTLAMAGAMAEGGEWVAVVGKPDLGVVAAREFGLDLARLVLIPEPGAHSPKVLATLIDGFDVVLIGERLGLAPAQRRALVGRARNRRVTLLTPLWPEAHLRLDARVVAWTGVGRGRGYLSERDVLVTKDGHGQQGQVRLTLRDGRFDRTGEVLRGVG